MEKDKSPHSTPATIGPQGGLGRSLALQTDAKIILGGASVTGSKYDFAILRYY